MNFQRPALRAACGALTLLFTSCASRDVPQPVDPFAIGPSSIELTYVLTLLDTAPRSVKVSLAFAGSDAGSTTLKTDESWASVEHPGRAITDLAAVDGVGRPVEVKRADDDTWVLAHEPCAALTASWTLRQRTGEEGAVLGNDYRTVATNDLFQMIGNIGLLYPPHLGGGDDDRDTKRGIQVEWRGFAEEGLATACSFGVGPGPFVVDAPISRFRHSVFIGGRVRVLERDIPGGRLAVAIAGDDWGFADPEFADLAARIVTAEREFFGDFTDPFFLITMIPEGQRRTERSLSLGGTGLTDSFALFVNPGLILDEGSRDRSQVMHLLAHEYFHHWNGGKIALEQPEQLAYWFSEGFTEFFTRRILFRAGLWSLDDYLENLNSSLGRLSENSAKNSPNQRIRDEFWKDRDVADLPYRRGDLIALAIDHELRAHSEGRFGLDELMKSILTAATIAGERVSCESLFRRIEDQTDADFAELVRRTIVDGADVPLRDEVAAPVLRLVPREIRPVAPGFDIAGTIEHKEVRGVLDGSPAWLAGLRDGQKLRSFDFDRNDPGRPLRITVVDGDVERPIEFDPRGPVTTVPLFEIADRDETRARTIL